MKVGFLQNQPVFGDISGNLDRIEGKLVGQTADLMVLPELCATGYQFSSLDEAKQLAESIPDGPTTNRLLKLAKLLQGNIELESKDGQGATFSLVIPLEYTSPSTPLMPNKPTLPAANI